MDRLGDRAAAWGIETQYTDGLGRRREAKPEVVLRLLAALARDPDRPARLLPRSIVVRGGGPRRIHVAAPTGAALEWEIFSDHSIASGTDVSPWLLLPPHLPRTVLRLRVTALDNASSDEATLIVCPRRTYQGSGKAARRSWGLALQLYGVRSARNWGHGDFTDLMGLIGLAAELGASAVGLNPLHALFDDKPSQASPYFPNSRLFLNPLYIDLDALPEFPGAERVGLEQQIAQLRSTPMVDYGAVAEAKLSALRFTYGNFRTRGARDRREAFENFRHSRGDILTQFASFEVLRRKFGTPWWEWPSPWPHRDRAALDELRRAEASEIGFFEFVQWAAHEQLDRCRARARTCGLPIGLYLDVAVGVRPDGFDAWCDQDAIMPEMRIGAPPDLLNRSGQDWGLAAFNPVALEDCRFEPYRRMLRASMQYAGAIRLDHVLGLQRLFLVPAGMSPADGLYIRAPLEALTALIAQASVEFQCIVVGEDLGTVPDHFRETMKDWGVWSYHVMLFERSSDGGFLPPESYRQEAVVTFATHDLPTFAGWREGSDLVLRRKLGLRSGETRSQRQMAMTAVRHALQMSGRRQTDYAAVARFLAAAPSRLLMISMEDLLGVAEQVNVPGTVDSYPNWRRRLPVVLENLASQEGVRNIARFMRSAERSLSEGNDATGRPD
jgi:4-alpha-glucanotransferase